MKLFWLFVSSVLATLVGCSAAHYRPDDASIDSAVLDDVVIDAAVVDAIPVPADVGNDAAACPAGRGDCDGLAVNGCETDVTTDRAHCSACRVACVANAECTASECVREEIVDVAISGARVLVLLASGRLVGWGCSPSGALFPSAPEALVIEPVIVVDVPLAVSLASNPASTWIVGRDDRALYGWGSNADGALATGSTMPVSGVVRGLAAPPLSAVFGFWQGGQMAACAIDAAGAVSCWGSIWPRPATASPVAMPLPRPARSVTALVGGGPFAALLDDGSIWMSGYNLNALFGDGGTLGRGFMTDEPIRVPSDRVFVDFGCNGIACYALAEDGQLWWWGLEWLSGLGVDSPAVPPTPFVGLPDIAQVEVSEYGALALATDGTVWRWSPYVAGSPTQIDLGTSVVATEIYGAYLEDAVSSGCARIGTTGLRCWDLWTLGDGSGDAGAMCGAPSSPIPSGVVAPIGFE